MGIQTPDRELAVAMRAAALATEEHSPRTAALKLSSFDLSIKHRAHAVARMARHDYHRDEAMILELALRRAQLGTTQWSTLRSATALLVLVLLCRCSLRR
jgi:hypothetical protein